MLLTLTHAAAYAGVNPSTIAFHRDFGSLCFIWNDASGPGKYVREDELRRWMTERTAIAERKKSDRLERQREKAERYEIWLSSQGLQRVAA